jgi:hypothetical protein
MVEAMVVGLFDKLDELTGNLNLVLKVFPMQIRSYYRLMMCG